MSIESDQHHGYNEHYEQENSRLSSSNGRPMYVYLKKIDLVGVVVVLTQEALAFFFLPFY